MDKVSSPESIECLLKSRRPAPTCDARERLRRSRLPVLKLPLTPSSPYRFGAEKGHKAGPDTATTTVGENVRLKLTAGGIKVRTESRSLD